MFKKITDKIKKRAEGRRLEHISPNTNIYGEVLFFECIVTMHEAQSEKKTHLSTANVCKKNPTLNRLDSIVTTYSCNTRVVKNMFSWDFGNTFSHEGLSR